MLLRQSHNYSAEQTVTPTILTSETLKENAINTTYFTKYLYVKFILKEKQRLIKIKNFLMRILMIYGNETILQVKTKIYFTPFAY